MAGKVKDCRIYGPGEGEKPSLPASRWSLYSSAAGLKPACLSCGWVECPSWEELVKFGGDSDGTECYSRGALQIGRAALFGERLPPPAALRIPRIVH